jgi:mono/diheme cytochrome c family protein
MRILAAIGVLAILACAAAAAFFYGGFYNVAASEPHNGFIAWSLEHIRDASIAQHAGEAPGGKFDDPALVKKGAHEFVEEGCVDCHGGPGIEPEKFAKGMRPEPPDLDQSGDLSPAEVHWIVVHGIKMTGMPAFGGHTDAGEQRALVAFVKNIKSFPPAEFKAIKQRMAQSEGGEAGQAAGETGAH